MNTKGEGQSADHCMETEFNKACKPDNPKFRQLLDQSLNEHSALYTLPNSDVYVDLAAKADCVNEDNLPMLFVQFSCIQSREEMSTKYNHLAIVTSSAVLIAFFFTITVKKLYQGGKIKRLEWDMAMITAADYSVELRIPELEYAKWNDEYYKKDGGDYENDVPPAVSLKKYLIKDIEETLTAELQSGSVQVESTKTRKNPNPMQEIKVADITFAFNNHKLIEALRKRGQLIAT